jgi:hypothetical protein
MFTFLKTVVFNITVVICSTIPAQSWLVDRAAILSGKMRKETNGGEEVPPAE